MRAQYNFWGAGNTTEEEIRLVIFDGIEQAGLVYVDFMNPLNESPVMLKSNSAGGAKERPWAR